MKSKIDHKALGNFIEHDKLDLEFDRIINNLATVEMEYGIDVIFKYYRKHGYPHYSVRHDEKYKIMRQLRRFDYDSIFVDKKIIQTMHGLRLAWSYFPHWVDVRCGTAKLSPLELFNDDELFRNIIRKVWIYHLKHEPDKFTVNRMRMGLKVYEGSQAVSNFRPTAAGVIYKQYGGDGVVYDSSCGWGGRLIGALASNTIKHYIGVDPSSKTYQGLLQIKKDFIHLGKKVEIYMKGSENFIPKEDSLDLVFTSPPYFDTEKYSDEPTQSYIKFPTPDLWIDGFLFNTFKNAYFGLKKGGYMAINIADTPRYNFIEEKTIEKAEFLGFSLVDTIQLSLSSISGAGEKIEPIFIFQKEGTSCFVENLIKNQKDIDPEFVDVVNKNFHELI